MRYFALLLLIFFTAGCAKEKGVDILKSSCDRCHTYKRVYSLKKDYEGWQRTIWAMKNQGAVLTDEEEQILLEYLARTCK